MEDVETLISLTADIVVAHLSNNKVANSDIPQLISSVHAALHSINQPAVPEPEAPKEPAVPIRSSIKPDHLVCLEDGKKLKMLKRHLKTTYDLTPEEYREKWGLPSDYPMVAPNYSKRRRDLAKEIGLGRKPRSGRKSRKAN